MLPTTFVIKFHQEFLRNSSVLPETSPKNSWHDQIPVSNFQHTYRCIYTSRFCCIFSRARDCRISPKPAKRNRNEKESLTRCVGERCSQNVHSERDELLLIHVTGERSPRSDRNIEFTRAEADRVSARRQVANNAGDRIARETFSRAFNYARPPARPDANKISRAGIQAIVHRYGTYATLLDEIAHGLIKNQSSRFHTAAK